jgi:hypothetical protein
MSSHRSKATESDARERRKSTSFMDAGMSHLPESLAVAAECLGSCRDRHRRGVIEVIRPESLGDGSLMEEIPDASGGRIDVCR